MNTIIPLEVRYVLDMLHKYKFEAYLVGGCVRDLILGRRPKDYDITSSATPTEVARIFERVVPTGIKYGTITVIVGSMSIEVTTFRADGSYLDNRRPDSVKFGVGVIEDVLRRDFTVNGLLFDGKNIIDHVAGLPDIGNRVIRSIGNPDKRFQEDALRMLRAIRFSSELGFKIDILTLRAIKKNSASIRKVSPERIRAEFEQILLSDHSAGGLLLFHKLGLMQYIIPELCECVDFDQHNPHHCKSVFDHILSVIENTPPRLNVRLAALFHDIAKPDTFSLDSRGIGHFFNHHKVGANRAKEIMHRLHFENVIIDNVCILIREHMTRLPELKPGGVKRLFRRLGSENIIDFTSLQVADILGSRPPHYLDEALSLGEALRRVTVAREPMSLRDLAVNGYDLINIGVKPGKQMGLILDELLNLVLDKPELNYRDRLLIIARDMVR